MQPKSHEALADGLTPLEIKNKEFKKSMMGYSPAEVVEFLDKVAKTWEKVQKNEKALIEEIRSLNQELAIWKNKEAEFETLREKAKQDAQKVREAAIAEAEKGLIEVQQKADEIRAKTEEWLASVLQEVEATQQRKNSFITAFRSALDQHYALLDEDQVTNDTLEQRLAAFLKDGENKNLETDSRLS